MHFEGAGKCERHVQALRMADSVLQKVRQFVPEIRVGAVLDNQAGTFLGGQATKVRKPLLGHKNLRIVFRMVHMAHVRDNARYGTALGQNPRAQ